MPKRIHKNKNGSIVVDCTEDIIVLDLVNSLGEKYHFENKPGDVDKLPVRESANPQNKSGPVLTMYMEMGLTEEQTLPLFAILEKRVKNGKTKSKSSTKTSPAKTLRPKK